MKNRFNKIDSEVAVIKAEIIMVKWFTGVVLTGMIALVLRAFWPA